MEILTYDELSDKLGISKPSLNIYASRSEMAAYDTVKKSDKSRGRKSRALICNKKSAKILYNLACKNYHKNFTQKRFMEFYNSLEDE